MLRALALLLTCVYTLSAQDRVPTDMLYHRVWAIVPIIGKGTADDPKRPMFAPTLAERQAKEAELAKQLRGTDQKPDLSGEILSYSMQLSDDKKSALAEFVAVSPKALAAITESKAPGVKVFERNKTSKTEIETEFQKLKKDFKIGNLQGRAE